MKMRVYYELLGGHVHMNIFTGRGDSLGKAGSMCMTAEEFEAWKGNTITREFIDVAEKAKSAGDPA